MVHRRHRVTHASKDVYDGVRLQYELVSAHKVQQRAGLHREVTVGCGSQEVNQAVAGHIQSCGRHGVKVNSRHMQASYSQAC